MGKRDFILDTMQELLKEEKGAACSVSDIAKRAGIAKGGLYYYFKSKEEVFDALVERTYENVIEKCRSSIADAALTPLQKLEMIYKTYRGTLIAASLDEYLHQPQNAHIHQKSLAVILNSLSPIIAGVICEGNEEGIFHCSFPEEISEFIMSIFCFLLDPGIFRWSNEQMLTKLQVLASIIETQLGIQAGSLAFFYASSPANAGKASPVRR